MRKKLIVVVASGLIVGGTIGAILGQASKKVSDTVSPVQAVVETIKDIPEGVKGNKTDNTTSEVKEKDSKSVTEVTKQEKQTNTKTETKKAAKSNKKVNNKKSETENSKEETKVTWQEEPDNSKYDKNGDYIYCFICGEPILGSSAEYGGEICHKECARKATENDEAIENYEKCYGNGDWESADQWTSVHDWEREKAQNIDEN